MRILKSVDASGNEQRKKNKLKRRMYKSKVDIPCLSAVCCISIPQCYHLVFSLFLVGLSKLIM
jgi:hypothetical protein